MHSYTSDEAAAQRRAERKAQLRREARQRGRDRQRTRQRYLGSQVAAQRYMHMAYANGAASFRPDIYERATAGIGRAIINKQGDKPMNEKQFNQLINLLQEINQNIQDLTCATKPDFRRTPEGLPICPRHGQVMAKREKQGDIWYSHQITDTNTGEVLYCRGYASKSSPGWDVQAETAVSHPDPPAESHANGNGRPADAMFEYTYGDGAPVPNNKKTRTIFNAYRRAHNEQAPASAEALRQWHNRQ